MFSYLILVGVASRLVNEFRILTHLLAISSYALCLPAQPLPFFNYNTTTPLHPPLCYSQWPELGKANDETR